MNRLSSKLLGSGAFWLSTSIGLLIVGVGNSYSAEHREQHGAHEHGKAEIGMAIDGKNVTIQLKGPGISMYGFEHEPKNAEQTKARDKAVGILKDKIGSIVAFDEKLGCQFSVTKIEPFVRDVKEEAEDKSHGEHGDLNAEFIAKCQKDPAGSTVKFAIWEYFPHINAIEVQIVGDKIQGGGEVSKKKPSLKL